MSISKSKTRRAFRVGAGVAALVGLSLAGAGTAQAATSFDPGTADSRVGGADRYATAALIAQQNWTSASTVIVANGETNGIDALSASYLAGLKDAPILLTRHDGVPADTAAALKKLNPTSVIVVGGEPSVSSSTYAVLTAGRTGQRIAGADRYETAAKLVQAGLNASTSSKVTKAAAAPAAVFVVRGDLYGDKVAADALAASPVAYRAHVPVVLTTPTSLPASSAALLTAIDPSSVYAVGDTRAVSASLEATLRSQLGLDSVSRLQGADRSETAAAIANSAVVKAAGFTTTTVGIANGYTVDALAAGPAAGKAGYPLLLTNSATDVGAGTKAYLEQHKDTLTSAKVFGDQSSVSASVVEAARSAAGGTDTSKTPPVTTPVSTPATAVAVTNVQTVSVGSYGEDQEGADVFGTFELGSVNPGTLSLTRVSVSDPAVRTAVHLEHQVELFESDQFIDPDVPVGTWRYEITTTVGSSTAVAKSPVVGIEVLPPAPGVTAVAAAEPTTVEGAGSAKRADVVISYTVGKANEGSLSLQTRQVSDDWQGSWYDVEDALHSAGRYVDVDTQEGARQWRVVERNAQGVITASKPTAVRTVNPAPVAMQHVGSGTPVAERVYGSDGAPEVIIDFSQEHVDPSTLTLQRRAADSTGDWTTVHHGDADEYGGFHDIDVPEGTWVWRIVQDNGQGLTAVSNTTEPQTVLPAAPAVTGITTHVSAASPHSDMTRPEVSIDFARPDGVEFVVLERRAVPAQGDPSDWKEINWSPEASSFVDEDVQAGVWQYRLGSLNAQDAVRWTDPVEVTVDAPPVGVTGATAAFENGNAVRVSFTLGDAEPSTLRLQRTQSGTAVDDPSVWETLDVVRDGNSFLDNSNTSIDDSYDFDSSTVWRVVAVNGQGAATASNTVTMPTPLD